MKILFLFLISFSLFASECEDKVSLLILFKFKDKLYYKMAMADYPKTGPLRCDLLTPEELKEMQKLKEDKLKLCQTGEGNVVDEFGHDGSLDDIIKSSVSGFDTKKCNHKNIALELKTLVKAVRNKRSVISMCNTFSPFNQLIYEKDKNSNCRENVPVQTSGGDGTSCEIAGPDGRCPGAPEPSPVSPPAAQGRAQTNSFIHWGKQGASAR